MFFTITCTLFFCYATFCSTAWTASALMPSDSQPSIDLDRCYRCNDTCKDEFEDSPCQCDSNCGMYGDCCISVSESPCTGQPTEPLDLQCLSVDLPTSAIQPSVGGTFWMVATCPVFWTAGESEEGERTKIASDCTGRADLPPVSDVVTGIVYKNENCAACNEVTNPVISWSYQMECPVIIQNLIPDPITIEFLETVKNECSLRHFSSNPEAPSPRPCHPHTATCLSRTDMKMTTGTAYSSEEYSELLHNCTQGAYSLVRPLCGSLALYRNQYCARCNGIDSELGCYDTSDVPTECPDVLSNSTEQFNGPPLIITAPVNPLSLHVLLDVQGNGQVVITLSEPLTVNVTCEPNKVFDPVNDICRTTVCSEEGTCTFLGNSTINCTSIALNASEYEILGNNTILWNGNVEEVQGTLMGKPLVCVNFSNNGTRKENRTSTVLLHSYPAWFVELTYIGGALSIIGCLLILATYTIFRELQNLPSKILMNIAAAILVYILFLLVGNYLGQLSQGFCVALAIIIQLFVLAEFSWMSIMLFEMVRSFHGALKLAPMLTKSSKLWLFLVYMVIGWGVPLVITAVTITVNFTTDFVLYGETEDGSQGRCWINHPNSLIVAFIVPISVAYLLNIVLLVTVSVFLFKAWRGQSKLKKDKSQSYLRIFLAVFTASGLTWVFGFIALLVGSNWVWYPFIILNSSQGFLLFIVFLCNKKIGKLYWSLFRCDMITKATLSKSASKTGMESRSTSRNGTTHTSTIRLSLKFSIKGSVSQSPDCDAAADHGDCSV